MKKEKVVEILVEDLIVKFEKRLKVLDKEYLERKTNIYLGRACELEDVVRKLKNILIYAEEEDRIKKYWTRNK